MRENSMARLALVFLPAASILAACQPSGTVQCADDTSCNAGAGGVCLSNPATGNQWCSYPDTLCPSGSRWSDQDVGDGLGGRCVAEDINPPVDGSPDGNTGGDGGNISCSPKVAFHDGPFTFSPSVASREVYVSNLDGTGLVNVSNSSASDDYHASWAPDGIHLAFQSNREGNYDIFVVRADGSGLKNLTKGSTADEQRPVWSPDGQKIAFLKGGGPQGGGIPWVMGSDGQSPRAISSLMAGSTLLGNELFWSPDSSLVLYAAASPNVPDLFVSSLVAGSQPINITNTSGAAEAPSSWAPNTRLAFSATGGDIFTADATGAGRQNVTNSPESDYAPRWSNAGTIFFVSMRGGTKMQIWKIAGTGGTPTQVTSHALTEVNQGDFLGDVSKDEQAVTFSRVTSDSQAKVGVIGSNGSGEVLFSAGRNNARQPSFAKCP